MRRYFSISLKAMLYMSIVIMFSSIQVGAQMDIQGDGIMMLAWNPDGTLIATTNTNGTIDIRDASGDILQTIDAHDGRVISLAWDPTSENGNRFATGGEDQIINIWDANSGDLIAMLAGHEDPVIWLSWSVNDRLASLGILETNNVRIWDTNNWEQVATPPMGSIDRFIWNPDGNQFAVVGPSTLVATGDSTTFEPITIFRVEETIAVTRVDWNPVSQQLVTSSWDATIRLWDLQNETHEGILVQLEGIVDFVQFSPDGTSVAGILDDQILIWNTETGYLLQTISEENTITALDWSPDGNQFAYGGISIEDGNIFEIVDVASDDE